MCALYLQIIQFIYALFFNDRVKFSICLMAMQQALIFHKIYYIKDLFWFSFSFARPNALVGFIWSSRFSIQLIHLLTFGFTKHSRIKFHINLNHN